MPKFIVQSYMDRNPLTPVDHVNVVLADDARAAAAKVAGRLCALSHEFKFLNVHADTKAAPHLGTFTWSAAGGVEPADFLVYLDGRYWVEGAGWSTTDGARATRFDMDAAKREAERLHAYVVPA